MSNRIESRKLNIFKAICQKTNDSKGFSLTEMLAVVMILVLATAMMVRIFPLAQQSLTDEVDASNAQLLMSTVATELRDELGTSDIISVTESQGSVACTITFISGTTGMPAYIKSSEEEEIMINTEDVEDSSKERPLVSTKASTPNMYAKFDSIEFDENTRIVTIENLAVVKTNGGVIAELPQLLIKSGNEGEE